MLSFLRTLVQRWSVNQNQTAAAAIAFYAIFLLAPTLFFAVAACGRFVGTASARQSIEQWLGGAVGADRATQLLGAIDVSRSGHNWLVGAVSALVLLYAASTAFVQVRTTLHQVFRVDFDSLRDQIWSSLIGRLLAALFAVLLGVLLVALMTLTALVSLIGGDGRLAGFGLHVLSVVVVTGLFTVVMHSLPRSSPPLLHVLIGAFVAAVLFEIGRYLMTLYLSHSLLAAAYGASGALVAVLIWTYYSAQMFLLGAEIAQLLSERSRAGHTARQE